MTACTMRGMDDTTSISHPSAEDVYVAEPPSIRSHEFSPVKWPDSPPRNDLNSHSNPDTYSLTNAREGQIPYERLEMGARGRTSHAR